MKGTIMRIGDLQIEIDNAFVELQQDDDQVILDYRQAVLLREALTDYIARYQRAQTGDDPPLMVPL